MTQKELIEFCKENDPNYNKDASFKVLEPMWSIPKGIGGLGITESEFKNGFYVEIDTKGRKGFENLEGRVFYFREKTDPAKHCKELHNSHWKKYFVPLNNLDGWGREVVKEDFGVAIKSTETQKGVLEQIKEHVLYAQMPSERLETMKELFEKPVEESPIVKESVETMFRLNHTWLKFRKREKPTEKMTFTIFDGEEPFLFEVTKEEFSDLVDLMIEARKDLLNENTRKEN